VLRLEPPVRHDAHIITRQDAAPLSNTPKCCGANAVGNALFRKSIDPLHTHVVFHKLCRLCEFIWVHLGHSIHRCYTFPNQISRRIILVSLWEIDHSAHGYLYSGGLYNTPLFTEISSKL
jgi:hypothetical protein